MLQRFNPRVPTPGAHGREGSPAAPARDGARAPGPRPERLRVGLFGFFGIENFGNDGSLEAVLNTLRAERADADVLCICGVPERIGREFRVSAIGINWRPRQRWLRGLNRVLGGVPGELVSLVRAARHLGRLDTLIVPGTGILDDYGTGPLGMPYWLFRWSLLARLVGTPVAFLSVGAGPIGNPLSRWLMRTAAGLAAYVSYRDADSRAFMRRIGCDTRLHAVCPDVAFALPEPPGMRPPRAEGEALTVGVGIMSYNGWRGDKASHTAVYETYLARMQRFILGLLERGYRVRLLMGDASDRPTVAHLTAALAGHPAAADKLVAEPASSLHDVMRQIVDTDVVVATRYHNVVAALKLGRPTLSIGYAKKNDVLLAAMGLGGFSQAIEDLDVDRLIAQFEALVAERKELERRLAEANAAFRVRLRRQETVLLTRFL